MYGERKRKPGSRRDTGDEERGREGEKERERESKSNEALDQPNSRPSTQGTMYSVQCTVYNAQSKEENAGHTCFCYRFTRSHRFSFSHTHTFQFSGSRFDVLTPSCICVLQTAPSPTRVFLLLSPKYSSASSQVHRASCPIAQPLSPSFTPLEQLERRAVRQLVTAAVEGERESRAQFDCNPLVQLFYSAREARDNRAMQLISPKTGVG